MNDLITNDKSMQRFDTLRDQMAVGGAVTAQELRMVMRNLGFKHSNEETNGSKAAQSICSNMYCT